MNIIAHSEPYGSYLAQVFEQTAQRNGVEINYIRQFDADNDDLPTVFQEIVAALEQQENQGAIFLATYAHEVIDLIKLIKDAGLEHRIIAPDTFASPDFAQGFNDFPKEHVRPGFYTDGTYVTTPMIFDTGNALSLKLVADFRTRYGHDPDWTAAFAYDAALLLVEAIRQTGATG